MEERLAPSAPVDESDHGISRFLDQLIRTLEVEQTSRPLDSQKISGPPGGGNLAPSEVSGTAARHGKELLQHGFTIDQVVHDYGDLCQAITDLAVEKQFQIDIDEYRTLNRCLDNAMAEAVTEFSYQRDSVAARQGELALEERLGAFAHEMRNALTTAVMAFAVIKAGGVGTTGATASVLDRGLLAMKNLIDRSLSEVRVAANLPIQSRLFSLADFVAEVKFSAQLEADLRGCTFAVKGVDRELAVDADRDLLLSAVGNLLQNAFKFTKKDSEVTLTCYGAANRVMIEVGDHCGGLRSGDAEKMFLPFTQVGEDKTGLGLGLSISRKSVEANNGMLSVRNLPGTGCVFTIDLPRYAFAS
ncbi:MAG TPA: HAMP domain-containing sensor histidine kinase [Pyrinomonadaceae bacterium]|nr:HAMP domain-containing sensor histidine kinase [Pyrinomonadaceae bacterium]